MVYGCDDRITCMECARFDFGEYEAKIFGDSYVFRGRCMAARPPMAQVPDLMKRCVYFNAKDGAADMRKGIERWPELKDAPGGPSRIPYPVVASQGAPKK